MNLPFFIARRYFFSRKNPSAINIITFIGIIGYAVGSFALVSLMSALNGFEKVIFSVYESYYPDIKVSPVTGKVFDMDSALYLKARKLPGVHSASFTLEESAVIENNDNQVVGVVKGVDAYYEDVVKTDSFLIAGNEDLRNGMAWVSEGLYYKINLGRENRKLHIMAPRREATGVAQIDMMEDVFIANGIIRPGDEMDQRLVVTELSKAQEVFEREGQVSALEIKIKSTANEANVRKDLQKLFGKNYDVRNRQQQNQAIYKMFNTEKWAAFSIMAFVLLIISFNLIGSLSMLVLEKKRDIGIMKAIGMSGLSIRRIFFSEGVMVAMVGAGIGILLGIGVVLLQQEYGFIKANATFSSVYPVALKSADILIILALCAGLGISGAIYPAWKSSGKS